MTKKLEGKIAVVTGANSGLGLAAAQKFVEEGAYVFITGRRQNELDAAVKKIGKNVTAVQGDLTKLADVEKLYKVVKEQKGHLDIIFANAGVYDFVPLELVDDAHIDKIFNLNFKGLIYTVQKALPLLKEGSSVILNASVVSGKGMPGMTVYAASKAAVRSLARTWAVELKDRKIRVNTLSPGMVPTEGYKTAGMDDTQIDQFAQSALPTIPLGRVGLPHEIANAASFLASDESSYITGIELTVDGGMGQI